MATIQDLPAEMIEYILSLVSPYNDLHSCMCVSKQWRNHVKNVVKYRKRSLYKSVANFELQWENYEPGEGSRRIGRRYSHCSSFHDNAMYVFGGCTCSLTTFNDLWKYDFSTKEWVRPLATGSYPSPKACATIVTYKDMLVLFGGWTYPPSYPLYQSCHMFNELHIYDIPNNHWNAVETSVKPPPMAGHSVSVIDDEMIVFGGLIKHNETVESEKSDEVWKLNMLDWTWTKHEVEGPSKPDARFGQTQVILDKKNLFILGGSAGTNIDFSDAWVLNMSNENQWKWIPVELRGKANKPKNIWCNPGCKVDDKLVVLNRLQTDRIFPLNSSRSHPNFGRPYGAGPSTSRQPDLDENVNGKRGTLRFGNPNSEGYNLWKERISVAEMNRRQINQRPQEGKRKRQKEYLGVYVLDLSHAMDDKPYVTWLTPKNYTRGPIETILYTLIEGNSELVMFGGIESDGTNVTSNNPITNSIHILSSNFSMI